ncbi:MAG: hypothetical protein ACD_65C00047G0001 [uncultured bacterium]|nr:MAG: hypothetical protein ACD_65C00047G0001 [uncultured bacterium]
MYFLVVALRFVNELVIRDLYYEISRKRNKVATVCISISVFSFDDFLYDIAGFKSAYGVFNRFRKFICRCELCFRVYCDTWVGELIFFPDNFYVLSA